MSKQHDDPKVHEQVARLLSDQPPLLTIAETAKLLRISKRTFAKLLAARRIRTVRYARGGSARVLIPRTAIAEFLITNLR